MTIPYTFAGATTAIPLAQLDANFASPITLGNVAMTLSNTYTSIGNLTLTNVTVSSGNVAVTNANVTTLTATNDASISGLTVGKGGGNASHSTVFGNGALAATNTGDYVTAIGYQAAASNTSGTDVVAMGYQALYTNTTGINLVGVGDGALKSNTTGNNSVAVGISALQANTTASNNTAVGYQAGYSNTTGANNTFIGYQAGYSSNAGTVNAYNTFVGNQAGYFITSGYQNTILGGYNGNQGGLDIRTASNYIVLSDGAGNPVSYWNANGGMQTTVRNNVAAWTIGATNSSNTNPYGILVTYNGTPATPDLFFAAINSTYKFYVAGSGAISSTSTSITSLSDQRQKENIRTLETGLAEVMALQPRRFDWKEGKGTGKKDVAGFIAQEVEQVLPDLVTEWRQSEEDATEYKAVTMGDMLPTLVKAIQELNAKVTALEAQLGAK